MRAALLPESPGLLDAPDELPVLQPVEVLARLGRILILAPHPDDESLACGGLIALNALQPIPNALRVVVLTDGTASHPDARSHSTLERRAVRERECAAALAILATNAMPELRFLRQTDAKLPGRPSDPGFSAAAAQLLFEISEFSPDTIITPWRLDPHGDHRATYQLLQQVLTSFVHLRFRQLEVPIWAWVSPDESVRPSNRLMRGWRLDTSAVLAAKRRAISAHASQYGMVFLGDPSGFSLDSTMVEHFLRPWEIYLEER